MDRRYRVLVTDGAANTLRALGHGVSKPVGYAIRQLEENPRPAGCMKLRGTDSGKPDLYRIHVDLAGGAAYRVFYTVADKQLLVVAVDVRLKTRHTYADLPALQRRVQEFLQDLDEGF